MEPVLVWITLGLFLTATGALAVYGVHLYVLVALFLRRCDAEQHQQRRTMEAFWTDRRDDSLPYVTTQLPIYNEQDVAARIMEAAARIDYPPERHEIQVLDDSTDDTRRIVDETARRLRSRGTDIHVVRRPTRESYKAGALAHGAAKAGGRYVAIFDADFVPPADFLHKAIPLLENNPRLACLQGRWDHLNRKVSWITEAQALGIDGHFAIEQGARAWNGLMMNFNGTAGVWRKAAIDDIRVGGWNGDTLTEDLDLSYRAQLAGWKIDYCLDLPCPAELPGTINDLKSQQRRWATGSIQVACRLLPSIWRAPLSLAEKLEATLHLTHYSVAVWMLILAVIARPMVLVLADESFVRAWLAWCWPIILVSAVAPSTVYAYARYRLAGQWSGLSTIPHMLVLGCGLCLSNALAVIHGLRKRGGEFVRTPKSGSVDNAIRRSRYQTSRTHLWLVELLLGVYMLASFVIYFQRFHRIFSLFLLIYAVGFLRVGWLSRPSDFGKRSRRSSSRSPISQAAMSARDGLPMTSVDG